MTQEQVELQIKRSIDKGTKMRVYFKQEYKNIKFGRFIKAAPDEIKRGYCRFLSEGREENFIKTGNIGLTMLLLVSTISQVKIYENASKN